MTYVANIDDLPLRNPNLVANIMGFGWASKVPSIPYLVHFKIRLVCWYVLQVPRNEMIALRTFTAVERQRQIVPVFFVVFDGCTNERAVILLSLESS